MLIQIFINSILSAMMLSLVAVGFNLIFSSTKVFHLAHGAIYVGSVYGIHQFSLLFAQWLSPAGVVLLSICLSFALVVVLISIIEYMVYRPLYLKGANPTISLVSSLGVYLLMVSVITFLFGNESITMGYNSKIAFANELFKLTNIELIQFGVSFLVICGVFAFSRTKFYTNIRAIADNYSVAEKFGINVQKARFNALILGSILVSIAGILKVHEVAISPNSGMSITLAGAVAVIIGGAGSLRGTVVACLVISLIQNFSILILSAQWKDTLTYILLISVLLIYQRGLISSKQRLEAR